MFISRPPLRTLKLHEKPQTSRESFFIFKNTKFLDVLYKFWPILLLLDPLWIRMANADQNPCGSRSATLVITLSLKG